MGTVRPHSVYTHRHTHTDTPTHRHTHTQTHPHRHTHTDTPTHRHTHTQTHPHRQAYLWYKIRQKSLTLDLHCLPECVQGQIVLVLVVLRAREERE